MDGKENEKEEEASEKQEQLAGRWEVGRIDEVPAREGTKIGPLNPTLVRKILKKYI